MTSYASLRLMSRRAALATLMTMALSLATTAHAADSTDENWPCQQRKVPTISAGQIWSGPPLDDIGTAWQDEPEVSALARAIVARRTSTEAAAEQIEAFAATAGPDKDRRLTLLAAGMLSLMNRERASIISGVERYAVRQRGLAEKIERETAELEMLPVDGTEAEQSERADLQEILDWDTRIFQEREHSLTYVCDLPVQIERRAFALGREIQRHLDP